MYSDGRTGTVRVMVVGKEKMLFDIILCVLGRVGPKERRLRVLGTRSDEPFLAARQKRKGDSGLPGPDRMAVPD